MSFLGIIVKYKHIYVVIYNVYHEC